jgi:cell shape-determining protein MreC
MSDNERPEQRAFRQLDGLVHHLADELAAFRRRALQAESRLKELEAAGAAGDPAVQMGSRVMDLERENERLREQLDTARHHADQMLDRVRFLRQQATIAGTGVGASSGGAASNGGGHE